MSLCPSSGWFLLVSLKEALLGQTNKEPHLSACLHDASCRDHPELRGKARQLEHVDADDDAGCDGTWFEDRRSCSATDFLKLKLNLFKLRSCLLELNSHSVPTEKDPVPFSCWNLSSTDSTSDSWAQRVAQGRLWGWCGNKYMYK